MHVLRPRADLARVLLAFSPLLGAALIAISRCEDYRHDVYDVTVGSLLGAFLAYFSYRRYFPPLRSGRCHLPYPSRAEAFAQRKGKGVGVGGSSKEERMTSDDGKTDDDHDYEEAVPLRRLSRDREHERDLERGIG